MRPSGKSSSVRRSDNRQVSPLISKHDVTDDAQAFSAVEAARESFLEDVIAIPGMKLGWE